MAEPVQIQVIVDPSGSVTGFQTIGAAGDAMGVKIITAAEAAAIALSSQTVATLKGADAVAVLTAQWETQQAAIAAAEAALKQQTESVKASTSAVSVSRDTWSSWSNSQALADSRIRQTTSAFQGMTNEQTKASIAGRLVEQTLGLQNRALNQVAARSQILGPLMAALFPLAIFAGVAPLIEKIGEKIIDVTDDLGGYTAAVKQIQQDTIQASEQAFVTPKTLEFGQQHLNQLNSEIALLSRASDIQTSRSDMVAQQSTLEGKIVAFLGAGLINMAASGDLQAKALGYEEQRRKVLEAMTSMAKELNDEVAKSQESTALIGKNGFAQIAQQHTNALADIGRNYKLDPSQDPAAIAEVSRKAAELRIDADNKEQAQILELRKNMAQETMVLQDRITENNLTGIAKIKQEDADQVKEALAAAIKKDGQSQDEVQKTSEYQAQVATIHQNTTSKIAAMNVAAEQQTVAMERAARDATLEGNALVLADDQDKRSEAIKLYAAKVIDVGQFLRQILAINIQTNAQIAANDKATADKKTADEQKFTTMMSEESQKQVDAQTAAALATVPAWQKASAQIIVEEQNRLRKIQDEEDKAKAAFKGNNDAINKIQATADAQRLQAVAEMNEKIRAENQRMTEQLGSDLQSAFDDATSGNLGKRVLANFEKFFFQIVAQWILSLNIMKSTFGQLAGIGLFGPGSMGANVFGGGGNPLSFFGNLGSPAASSAAAGSATGGAIAGSAFPSSAFSSFTASSTSANIAGLAAGGGLSSAIAGTSATTTGTLGLPAASNDLTSASLAGLSIGSSVSSSATNVAPTASKSGLFGNLFSAKGLAGLGPIASLLASALGGKVGQIGGALTAATFTILPKLLSSLGVSGAITPLILGPLAFAGAGLTGFGLGQTQGGLLGALGGAGSGALSGLLIGGPVGAVVGGIIGLLGGIFGGIFGGSKRKKQANDYANNTVVPDITQITQGFDSFQIDPASAIQQLEQLRTDSQKQLDTLKSQGKDVFNNTVGPAIDAAEKHINDINSQRTARASVTFGPPQFDTGGMFSVGGNAGLAVLHNGEFVINPEATKKHLPTLASINAGGSPGTTIGELHIHAGTLDRRYVKGQQFQKDIINALTQASKEGKI